MQTPRPYQQECVSAVFDALIGGVNRILFTHPTGTGKTTTIAELCRILIEYNDARILCIAHRRELITQMYQRIKDHCNLDEWGIGTEIGQSHAAKSCRVVVGSVQTLYRPGRLPEFMPTVIITDEAHHGSASTYQAIYNQYGVGTEGGAISIGCTATPKRTDRLSLCAQKPDGSPVYVIDRKTKKPRQVEPAECPFDVHAYDYTILDATRDGWIVPIRAHVVETETDISEVKTDYGKGDFQQGALAKAVDNAERTVLAINAWKEVASERSTLVFCASVEHAHHSADLWKQAGYTAAALDGETENRERYEVLEQFRKGEIQVLCNMGLFTEGMDAPRCGCIVHLRPTKSWNLYVQMTGRGLRVLPGIVDLYETPAQRRTAILQSAKPDCLVIDLVDICESNDLCAVPSILDLPANLDLQGETLDAAKAMLDDFEEVRERVIGECPTTFEELKVRLREVDLLRTSGAKSAGGWKVRGDGDGYRYTSVPPGYQAEMRASGDGYLLTVRRGSQTILEKEGKPGFDFSAYLDKAQEKIEKTVHGDRAAQALLTPKIYETVSYLQSVGTGGLYRTLRARGYSDRDINAMPPQQAAGYAKTLAREYHANREQQESASA